MKLLEMKRVADKAIGDVAFELENQEIQYMVKLDDSYENAIYNDISNSCDDNDYADYNKWLKDNIGVTDYDVAYYFMNTEQEPALGATFELDDIKYERIG